MDRRLLLKLGAACLGTAAARPALGFVPAHNWDGYNWGTAPVVKDRLYQGPFPPVSYTHLTLPTILLV